MSKDSQKNIQRTIEQNATWFQMTKLMFWRMDAFKVFSMVEQALVEVSDEQWFEKKYPRKIFMETFVEKKKKKFPLQLYLNDLRKTIYDNVKISVVLEHYGVKIVRKGQAICPFHADTNPSLSFDDDKGVFHCFGCGEKGKVLTLIKKLEERYGKKRT